MTSAPEPLASAVVRGLPSAATVVVITEHLSQVATLVSPTFRSVKAVELSNPTHLEGVCDAIIVGATELSVGALSGVLEIIGDCLSGDGSIMLAAPLAGDAQDWEPVLAGWGYSGATLLSTEVAVILTRDPSARAGGAAPILAAADCLRTSRSALLVASDLHLEEAARMRSLCADGQALAANRAAERDKAVAERDKAVAERDKAVADREGLQAQLVKAKEQVDYLGARFRALRESPGGRATTTYWTTRKAIANRLRGRNETGTGPDADPPR
jgi:hypothetical protein